MSFIRNLLNSKWPAITWTVMIFVLLTTNTASLGKVPFFAVPHLDKIVHIVLFGTFVFLWWSFFSSKQESFSPTNMLILFSVATAFGIGMEFYQKYFTLREFELKDIYADTAGAAIASFFCSYLKNKPLWK